MKKPTEEKGGETSGPSGTPVKYYWWPGRPGRQGMYVVVDESDRHTDSTSAVCHEIVSFEPLRFFGTIIIARNELYGEHVSYKGEVIADNSGKWVSNQLRFATAIEATEYVKDLSYRWTLVRKTRVEMSNEPVNYRWENGQAVPLKP